MKLKDLIHLFSRNKQYYLTVIGSLSLMLAMVFSVFSLMSLVFWQPLPYKDSEGLHWLEGNMVYQGTTFPGTNPRNLEFVAANSQSISGYGAYFKWSSYKLSQDIQRPEVDVIMATHELFDVLGTTAFMGRLFNQEEAFGNKQPSAILSHHIWQKHFDSDPQIIGKKVHLNQRSFTIVGVTQPNLVLPQEKDAATAIWLPFDMDEQVNPKTFGGYSSNMKAIVRLQEGISPDSALDEFKKLMLQGAELHTPNMVKEYPIGAQLTYFVDAIRGDSVKLVFMLLGGVVLLLLIGVINLSSLQLARAVGRTKQQAIAAAFGASKRQLLSEVIKHNLSLVLLSSLIALVLSISSFGLIKGIGEDAIPRLNELSINLPVLGLALLTAIVLAAIFSWAELSSVNYDKLQQNLQSSGKGTGKQIKTSVSHTLIGLQLGLALLTLVACSQVVFKTLSEALRPTGINTENLATLHLNLAEIESEPQRENLFRSLKSELQALPSVQDMSYSSDPVYVPTINIDNVKNAKGEMLTSSRKVSQDLNQFNLLGLTVRGEDFTESDISSKAPVVIINQRLADFLPKPVLGQKLNLSNTGKLYTVKGVVPNINYPGASFKETSVIYYPRSYQQAREATLLLKLNPNQNTPTLAEMYQTVIKVHPKLDILEYSTVSNSFAELSQQTRFAAIIAGVLALCSLIMVTAGIFGIVSYLVRMKQYDLGVHLAFGATLKGLRKEQLLKLSKPLSISLFFAASLVYFASGYVRTTPELLFTLNWALYALVILLLLLLAAIACFIPLNQVIKANPIKSLRNE